MPNTQPRTCLTCGSEKREVRKGVRHVVDEAHYTVLTCPDAWHTTQPDTLDGDGALVRAAMARLTSFGIYEVALGDGAGQVFDFDADMSLVATRLTTAERRLAAYDRWVPPTELITYPKPLRDPLIRAQAEAFAAHGELATAEQHLAGCIAVKDDYERTLEAEHQRVASLEAALEQERRVSEWLAMFSTNSLPSPQARRISDTMITNGTFATTDEVLAAARTATTPSEEEKPDNAIHPMRE
jgi:hypothetical protein